jgi:anti-sigma regulatory factor (Ser/Thr protein kinase)
MAVVGERLVDLDVYLDVYRSRAPVVLGCLRLAARAENVGRARRFVRMVLDLEEASRGPTEDAEAIASELVTNVVVHDDWDLEPYALVALARSGPLLRIEVHDSCSYMGEVGPASESGESGRGLRIVAELAERWGVDETPDGKCVWAELVAWPVVPDRLAS